MTKKKAQLSQALIHQLNILKAMTTRKGSEGDAKPFQVEEIGEIAGVIDERDLQRHLFILEGQKLVSPLPAGDFTSKLWVITRDGQKIVRKAELADAA